MKFIINPVTLKNRQVKRAEYVSTKLRPLKHTKQLNQVTYIVMHIGMLNAYTVGNKICVYNCIFKNEKINIIYLQTFPIDTKNTCIGNQ